MGPIHDIEFKIRLTEADADLLVAIARREGIPPAVLGRMFVKRQMRLMLREEPTPAGEADGRP